MAQKRPPTRKYGNTKITGTGEKTGYRMSNGSRAMSATGGAARPGMNAKAGVAVGVDAGAGEVKDGYKSKKGPGAKPRTRKAGAIAMPDAGAAKGVSEVRGRARCRALSGRGTRRTRRRRFSGRVRGRLP